MLKRLKILTPRFSTHIADRDQTNSKLPLTPPYSRTTFNTSLITTMVKKAAVPDAWEDDWEAQADKAESTVDIPQAGQEVKITKAERLAKHAETNLKIWQNA
jgi:hypothetical protein